MLKWCLDPDEQGSGETLKSNPDLSVYNTNYLPCSTTHHQLLSVTKTSRSHLLAGILGEAILSARITVQAARLYIYNGGWVVLKCSANYHLCIFGLGLRGLWVLWAACQRWNRKEKCSWKRMRRLRAPDLWNSSLQMKCTLALVYFSPSIFSISC